jgi:hypothetical protein
VIKRQEEEEEVEEEYYSVLDERSRVRGMTAQQDRVQTRMETKNGIELLNSKWISAKK